MADLLSRRDRHLRLACLLLIAAIGLRAAYAGLYEVSQYKVSAYWGTEWAAGYACFLMAYAMASRAQVPANQRLLIGLLSVEAAAAIYLVWLYPSFIVTCLLVVVAWQIAWSASLSVAIAAALLQSGILAAIKCNGEPDGLPFVILVITCGLQAFAISAAWLARSEAAAHDALARVNEELRATQALMAESARMSERLRISRDLHDILGHSLTTLAIHLDVASRLVQGQAVQHVRCAREVAGNLLAQVRNVVNHIRVEPVDLRAALVALTDVAADLKVKLVLPDELAALDPARADAVIRCVQEVVTNTLRHAHAEELVIELQQCGDGAVVINARDNGRGGRFVEGRGLAGMRERFEMLGGNLRIASLPGEGFSITAAIPAVGAFS